MLCFPPIRRNCLSLALAVVAGFGLPAVSSAEIAVKPEEGKLRVEIDGRLFTEYRYQGYEKPILYPIIGPYEIGMTRNYPMRKGVKGEAVDHPHHQSMWFTHGNVNGIDFWSIGDKAGRTVHDRLLRAEGGPERGVIATANRWVAPDGTVVCTDTRELTFHTVGEARLIDWKITLFASQGDVHFGDTKEGTMGIRTHPNLRLKNDERQGVTTANGHATNSEGQMDGALWGKRAKWVDYWGEIDGHKLGMAIFDHPQNFRSPTWWHARDYGLVAANPFGIHDFEAKAKGAGDYTLANGDTLTLRYRFVFHPGDLLAAKVAELYEDFARSPADQLLQPTRKPDDRRLGALKDLDGYFPFEPPASLDAWRTRAEAVRQRILVATGLWPMPPRGPVTATIHGAVQRDGYTVEKVYLESYPGHFVTGSLYRPQGFTGPRPAVLCPHGHWADGRFYDAGLSEVRNQIVQGAERFEVGGRYPLQARCVQLARMGCIVFHYDMVGYADSQQISYDLAHRHSEPRPAWETRDHWGLYSAQAEMRAQNIMGLQTFNSLRALDFLEGLNDVDRSRLAITGASGGGTQTMILGAIDPRLAVAFPAVMVSTAMQGGCTCENASCLRVDTGNIEFAALFAPKPLGMTGANDWTVEISSKGFPELQKLYELYGVKQNVMAAPFNHFGHNYNYVSRHAMYEWMNRHLKLGLPSPIVEEDYTPLTTAEMSVWNDQHPRPVGGDEHELALTRAIDAIARQQWDQLQPTDAASLGHFRDVVGGAFRTVLARDYDHIGALERNKVDKRDQGDYYLFHDSLRNTTHGEQLPAVFLHPKRWTGSVVLWISGRGKASLFDDDGQPRPEAVQLLQSGAAIAGADLLYQGDFVGGGVPPQIGRKVANNRDCAAYTFGYNPTLFAARVHDIMTLAKFVIDDEHRPQQVHLLGIEGAGPFVAAAKALLGDRIGKTAIDTQGFRFETITSWRDPNFLPGAIKYGDLPGLLALAAPSPLWLTGEFAQIPAVTAAAYRAAGSAQVESTNSDQPVAAAIAWLKE